MKTALAIRSLNQIISSALELSKSKEELDISNPADTSKLITEGMKIRKPVPKEDIQAWMNLTPEKKLEQGTAFVAMIEEYFKELSNV